MKHIILIVAIFATSFATAQNVDSLQWFTNIEKAKSAAAENEHLVFNLKKTFYKIQILPLRMDKS
jgi:hypothetical protein